MMVVSSSPCGVTDSGKALSDSQLQALLKIASRYAAKIQDYAELVTALGATIAPAEGEHAAGQGAEANAEEGNADEVATKRIAIAPPSEETLQKIETLISMVKDIEQWRQPPPKAGRKNFDDQDFAKSLVSQYEQKG